MYFALPFLGVYIATSQFFLKKHICDLSRKGRNQMAEFYVVLAFLSLTPVCNEMAGTEGANINNILWKKICIAINEEKQRRFIKLNCSLKNTVVNIKAFV